MTDPMLPRDLTCDDVRELAGAYMLGALPEAESAAVRAHLATCSDPHEEMAELGSVLTVLDASVPVVEPPASLKGRILAAAAYARSPLAHQALPWMRAALDEPVAFYRTWMRLAIEDASR